MAGSKRPTIKDVARRAGVTSAVVSRVINDDKTLIIRPETKQAVLEAVKETGYMPNVIARNLRLRRSNMIGLIIVDWMNPFYGSLIRGTQRELRDNGLFCLVSESQDISKNEIDIIKHFHELQVEGIIIATIKIKDPVVELLESLGIKYVQATRRSESSSAPSIYYDNYGGMKEIICHLVELGHNKIAYISGSTVDSPGRDRLNGYIDGLSENGIGVIQDYVVGNDWSGDNVKALTRWLLRLPDRPTAIITFNDAAGLRCLSTIKEMGLRIPEDISMASFNNIEASKVVAPALSTVDTPMEELGRRAAQMLLNEIKGLGNDEKHVVIGTCFVRRESTGPVPAL